MKRMNLGCSNNILEGWDNVDIKKTSPEIMIWDCRVPYFAKSDKYDFVLLNHVLCTMNWEEVNKVLDNVYDILNPGGVLQIIDMDLLLAFDHYKQGKTNMIPASGTSLDHKFVNHISGFGTRKSLYTKTFLVDLLQKHGYSDVKALENSEYDLRPNESLIVEGKI